MIVSMSTHVAADGVISFFFMAEKAMAPHSSTLAWKIPWMEEPGGAAVHGVARSRTRLSDFTFTFHFSLSCIGEGNGNPLQCSCLENSRDRGAWWAAVSGVAQSRTQLKRLSSSSSTVFSIVAALVCIPIKSVRQLPFLQCMKVKSESEVAQSVSDS